MTVSLALRNHPRISVRTKQKIKRWALKLGYQPDPCLSALVGYRNSKSVRKTDRSTLAVLNNWPNPHFLEENPASAEALRGMRTRAAELGYKVEPFWLREFSSNRQASKVLRNRGIEGIIVEYLPTGFGHISLSWEYFSVVSLGFSLVRPNFNRIIPDLFKGTLLAIKQLRRMNYKKLGLIIPRYQGLTSQHLIEAAFQLETQNKPTRKKIPILFLATQEKSVGLVEPWLKKYEPDAVISESHVRHLIQSLGWKIPNDLAFASFHLSQQDKGVTGISLRNEEFGRIAVDQLHAQLISHQRGIPATPITILTPVRWEQHQSTRAR